MSSFYLRLSTYVFCAVSAACHEGAADTLSGARDSDEPARFQARREAPDDGARKSQTVLATSPSHSCALRDGRLFCWGQNFVGQLGGGGLTDSDRAVAAVVPGMEIVQVALSTGRTCVRGSTGAVACWGANEVGQRGDGTRDEASGPTFAVGVSDAVGLAIDDQTSCVISGPERTATCWGGDSGSGPLRAPTKIADVAGVVELRTGLNGEYCGRLQDGAVRCWSLVDDAWTAAQPVPALAGARSIAMAGFGAVCAIVGSGPILCHNYADGKSGTLADSAGRQRIIGAGSLAACAVDGAGAWTCWNVLSSALDTMPAIRIDAPADQPVLDMVFAGFQTCALFAGNEVGCGIIMDWKFPTLTRIAGLPE